VHYERTSTLKLYFNQHNTREVQRYLFFILFYFIFFFVVKTSQQTVPTSELDGKQKNESVTYA